MTPADIFIAEILTIVVLFTGFDIWKVPYGKELLIAVLVLANIFVLPRFFYPEYKEGEPQCGLPAMAISILFWVVANLVVTFTVIFYWGMKWLMRKVG
jgi:hypothetical protein